MSTEVTQPTIGQEIMRTAFSGSPKVKEWKEKYAKLFDEVSELAMTAQQEIDTPPGIYTQDNIQKHMELCRKNEESIRCFAEASRILETSCMYLVKGITA